MEVTNYKKNCSICNKVTTTKDRYFTLGKILETEEKIEYDLIDEEIINKLDMIHDEMNKLNMFLMFLCEECDEIIKNNRKYTENIITLTDEDTRGKMRPPLKCYKCNNNMKFLRSEEKFIEHDLLEEQGDIFEKDDLLGRPVVQIGPNNEWKIGWFTQNTFYICDKCKNIQIDNEDDL